MQCDPCSKGNLKKNAVIYCQDCNESLCQQCKDYHGRSKIGITHTLSDIKSVPYQQDKKYLTQLRSCLCRTKNKKCVEFFCKDHSVFCCGKCIISKHIKCSQVDEIKDRVAKSVGKQFDFPLGTLETQVQELTVIASKNAELAETSYKDVKKRLEEVKDAIDEAFNELKTKVLRDAKSCKQALMNEIQQQNQNIETLSMTLNEQKANVETVNKYGTEIDKHIFGHFMETSHLMEMMSTASSIRSSLMPRHFTTKEKYNIVDIVKKLEEAIVSVDKELITGSDSLESTGSDISTSRKTRESQFRANSPLPRGNDSIGPSTPASQKKPATPVLLSGSEQTRRMKKGIRVVRGPDWWHENQDGGPGGRGTVVCVRRNGVIEVSWDRSDGTYLYDMGRNGQYQLQLAD